jgi:DNA polymerase III gamma/tau subunit
MTDVLHKKYRPKTFAEVVGQAAVTSSLSKMIERHGSQAFLFSGPSGTGKTTLARIAASKLGCTPTNIIEIAAAKFTGVEDMRQLQDGLQYRPFGKSTQKAFILDECHRLSRQAWDSLLKVIEEPPDHVTWFLCTTEVNKVPNTIKTRCAAFTLKPVEGKYLGELLDRICDKEKLDLPDDVGDLIIKEAKGSPRQMLVNLALCRDTKTKKQAADILRTALQSDPTLELCRFLMAGGSWTKAAAILAKLEGENPEGVRILVVNYVAAALRNAKGEKEARFMLGILEFFSEPYNSSENMAPLLLSVGRVLYSNGE